MHVNVRLVKLPLSLPVDEDKAKVGDDAIDDANEDKHSMRELVSHVSN